MVIGLSIIYCSYLIVLCQADERRTREEISIMTPAALVVYGQDNNVSLYSGYIKPGMGMFSMV